MIINIQLAGKSYSVDLDKGIDISSTLGKNGKEIRAWYVNETEQKPVEGDGWIGSVEEGSSVNFYNIFFNPHGNGTHTEGFGHISKERESINDQLKEFHFIAYYVDLKPIEKDGDLVLTWESLANKISNWDFDALIIKGGSFDEGHNFSNTNPPYFDPSMIEKIRDKGIKHILTNLPSVDREEDEGRMSAHKAWWNFPENPREDATITELLHLKNDIKEGYYFMNLQVAPFQNDASPSRPVLYPLVEIE